MQKKGDMSMKDGSPEYECLWRLQKRDMGYQDNVQKKRIGEEYGNKYSFSYIGD